jgi:hypothetical protein
MPKSSPSPCRKKNNGRIMVHEKKEIKEIRDSPYLQKEGGSHVHRVHRKVHGNN